LNTFINNDLPEFSQIKPTEILGTIRSIIDGNRINIDQIIEAKANDWKSLIEPMALMDDRLNKAWSPIRHLNSVKSSDELRDAYEQCLPVLSEYSTEVGQNQKLFKAYKKIKTSTQFEHLDDAQQKAITDSLKHFKLAGVDLSEKDRKRYQQLEVALSELQSSFENNLLDSAQSWQFLTDDENDLAGLPDYAVDMLRQLAKQKDLPGFRITLDMPCFISVITYAENRDLREKIYKAYSTRASDQGVTDIRWDNNPNMLKILQKRLEKSQLLGLKNYAEYSLQTKMAESVTEVIDFLEDLARRSQSAALNEVKERQLFAEKSGFSGELEAWDFGFFSEKLKHHRYQISEEDLKPYFADNQVIAGLFEIVENLYDINIFQIKDDIDLWDLDVRFYQISNSDNQVIGQFYLDLYSRENKRSGAWMDECINRYKIDGHIQIPVAYLTCNLTPPIGDQPALFTHDEVITLFHEFGHGLHHMLTRIDVSEVAGINGVEWDAVELPSQFMENFCWQREALDKFARHYKTDEKLPQELFGKMIAARNFQSALQMLRQIEFSLFDMRLHELTDIASVSQVQDVLDTVRNQVSVVKTPNFNRFQNGFSHIFAGGYAAGYYSYKWAEVLSADAFAAFEEEGVFNKKTGTRFLQCVLEKGGSRPAIESFRCFRGRDPEISALLRHSGISQK
jgi:oligopeptidase A